jgi:hypothetical protein
MLAVSVAVLSLYSKTVFNRSIKIGKIIFSNPTFVEVGFFCRFFMAVGRALEIGFVFSNPLRSTQHALIGTPYGESSHRDSIRRTQS